MTEQEIEKLQRGIEASLRDLHALDFGATVRKEKEGRATVIVRPKPGYDTGSEPLEQQKIADDLRLALIGRGYDVTSDLVPPSQEGEFFSFSVRGH